LLTDDLWLANAEHANAMASQLAGGFADRADIKLPWPVEANELFPVIPAALRQSLREEGLEFYDWPAQPDMARFVTHFATEPQDVARALEIIATA